ncbi:hypothetical protein H0X10_00245 [Candidatus Saccharibacteria bacterium]|nr:hypothetical protein [Candidatus Saccharibacteria bacterium]
MTNGDDNFPNGPLELPGEPEITSVSQRATKSGFSKKRIALVIFGLVILASIGFGAALLFGKENAPEAPAATTQNIDNNQAGSSENDVPAVTSTKTFKADFPRIEFTYPGNWVANANSEQEGVRIESPEFSYTSINGGTIKGNFRIYIRQGARQQDSTYIGRGIAIRQSEKLVYVNPPPGQRPETNLSFFGLDTSDNFAFFMIAGNFSLEKDQSLGPEYGKEAETYIITGGYSSTELSDDLATNQVPLDYFQTTNAYKQAIDILKSLKLL